jgi:regulator of sigma E protease
MLGVLVVVHEFGHFLFAKLFGVGAPVFSVGIGPRLFGFVYKGTDYRVSAFPIGGYVQMAGSDPFGEGGEEDDCPKEENFMLKPIWQRLIIMAAGPVFNLILPVVVFTAILMLGQPQPASVVGSVLVDSAAEHAGFVDGDVITAVDGEPILIWVDFIDSLAGDPADTAIVSLTRDGEPVDILLPRFETAPDKHVNITGFGLTYFGLTSRIGVVAPDSPVGLSGMIVGDAIVAVDGVSVASYSGLKDALNNAGESVSLDVLRLEDGAVVEKAMVMDRAPYVWPISGDPFVNEWGIMPSFSVVGSVKSDSAAERAGILAGDRIFAVNGQFVRSWSDLIGLVGLSLPEGAESPIALSVEVIRDGVLLTKSLTPDMVREVVIGIAMHRPIIGITQYPDSYTTDGPTERKYYSFSAAASRGYAETAALFSHTLTVLGDMIVGKTKPTETLGGPVAIFQMAGMAAEQGPFRYAQLVGMISISLGIINLLPIPVFDGGHILFYLLELVRGRPLSLAVRERIQMVGVLAIMSLFLFVTISDINKWWFGG